MIALRCQVGSVVNRFERVFALPMNHGIQEGELVA